MQFQAGSVAVDENAGTASVTITRVGGSADAVSVSVASSDGSASAAQDYSAVSTTVSFAAGDAVAKTVSVSIADDAAAEADETLTLTLSSPTGGASLGTTAAATLTIRDNDPPAAPLLTLGATIKQLTFTWPSVPGVTSYRLLRDPDRVSGFTQVGADLAAGATGTTLDIAAVHRHDWLNTLYRVDACNAHGCAASEEMAAFNVMLQAIGYFKASNAGQNDFFGTTIALSADGNTLAIGARDEDSNAAGVNGNQLDDSAPSAGAVYVFVRNGAQWSQQAYVKASNTRSADFFGTSLALSADGNTLVVGAEGEDSKATGVNGDELDDTAFDAGAAYVFTRTAGQWSQQAYVKASNTESSDAFGHLVALSDDGNTLAVIALGESSSATGVDGDPTDNSATFAGAAYVFTRTAAQWSQQAYVKASNTERFDFFGWALALSGDGNTLAVGAVGEDSGATGINADHADNGASQAGAAYVFRRTAGQWSQQAYVKASLTEADDHFASALSLSGDGSTLAVSALDEDSSATGVGGDQANNDAPSAGAAYVFTRAGTTWSQQAYVKASNTERFDGFGFALSLSGDGNTLAVGTQNEDSDARGIGGDQTSNRAPEAGAAYVFMRSGTTWLQQAYVKAPLAESEDQFGCGLALSADGNTLAISALNEASNATGIGGDQTNNDALGAGAVYVF